MMSLLLLAGCATDKQESASISSPSGINVVTFMLTEEGMATYSIKHNGSAVIAQSGMGFTFIGLDALNGPFEITQSSSRSVEDSWEMPWGEQRVVENKYNEMTVSLKETSDMGRTIDIVFRVYDDGVGFRYRFPEWNGIDTVMISDENTEFQLTGDHTCWWIPGDWDIYEHVYETTRFSEIDAIALRDHPNLAQTHIPFNAVNTPVTMRSDEGLHLSFHEANLTDYSGMTLKVDPETLTMTSGLVGSERNKYKVKRALPFDTPWRTIQISENAGGLIESNLITNLNEPNKLGDVSWFKPMKYVGIWWEMHLDKSTWDMASGRHGATTENTKRYIDFAAENGFGGVLVEGWNTGWEHWRDPGNREGVFDFVTPYPDYDLEALVEYAGSKGVEIIMHHETSAAPRTYDQQLDAAYGLMKRLGIHAVKTGYVGKILPEGEYHHGQWMVNHYRRVVEKGAEQQVAINAHEPIKATGIRRTYPNVISREGLRGQEFNAWASDGGNPPEHLPIVAFTRMLSGPIDFTPGAFDIKLEKYKPDNQINTTLAHQLALYVVIYSPIQMACDLPEHYEGQPAFQFIREVGVDWEQSKVLNGEVGDYVTIAREERGTGNWFVGAVTDEEERTVEVDFSFLDEGVEYIASVYSDGLKAHWDENPLGISITNSVYTSESKETFRLAPGGGLAISLMKK